MVYMGVSPYNPKEVLCLFLCQIFKKLAGLCCSPNINQQLLKKSSKQKVKVAQHLVLAFTEDRNAKIINHGSFLRI